MPEDEIDAMLGVCATYGTLVLGTPEQEHYIKGFKASKTYKEAKAKLQALLLRSRIDEHRQLTKRVKQAASAKPEIALAAVAMAVQEFQENRLAEMEQQLKELEKQNG